MATKRKPVALSDLSGELVRSNGERWLYNVAGLPAKTPAKEKLGWVVADEPRLAFGFTERGGRIVWCSFAYLGDAETELSSRTWRYLELGKWADKARLALVDKMTGAAVRSPEDLGKTRDQALRDASKRVLRKRPRGTAFTPEELAHFAALYREARNAAPRSPLKYFQERLGKDGRGRLIYPHRSSAQRRVDAARRAGLLDDIE